MVRKTKNTAIPVARQPSLAITGVPGALGRRLGVIDERHPLYGVAALVFLRGDQLSDVVLRALYGTLLAGWPKKQGDRPDDYRAHLAASLARMGASVADIARAWNVDISTARKRVRRGERRLELYDSSNPNTLAPFTLEVVIAPEDADRITQQDERVLPLPLDPGTDEAFRRALELRLPWEGVDPDERADDAKRMIALARQLPNVQVLDPSELD